MLSPLMCINKGVLFRITRVWWGIVLSVAAFINNGCRLDSLVTEFQDKAV